MPPPPPLPPLHEARASKAPKVAAKNLSSRMIFDFVNALSLEVKRIISYRFLKSARQATPASSLPDDSRWEFPCCLSVANSHPANSLLRARRSLLNASAVSRHSAEQHTDCVSPFASCLPDAQNCVIIQVLLKILVSAKRLNAPGAASLQTAILRWRAGEATDKEQ